MAAPPQASLPPSRLYVSNLSQAATLASVRELFATCGTVLEVEFAAERDSRSPRSAAYITMASSVAADRALTQLQGRLHRDRLLMISRVTGEPVVHGGQARAERANVKVEPCVALTQQYRDRHGLTCELSCAGKLLTLRFLFPVDDADCWQLEARLPSAAPPEVTVSAMTREQAFLALVDAWSDPGGQRAPSPADWEQVSAALRAVRAL